MIPEIEYYKLASKDLQKLREMIYEMEMEMSKSQNTKNEHQNDTLTEQWKKGEFIICNAGKCQYYYVRNEEQQEVIKTEYCLFDDNTPNWQILAPVPSYDEWQAKLEENAQLKELLRIILSKTKICYSMVFQKDIISAELNEALLKKIDEALK